MREKVFLYHGFSLRLPLAIKIFMVYTFKKIIYYLKMGGMNHEHDSKRPCDAVKLFKHPAAGFLSFFSGVLQLSGPGPGRDPEDAGEHRLPV